MTTTATKAEKTRTAKATGTAVEPIAPKSRRPRTVHARPIVVPDASPIVCRALRTHAQASRELADQLDGTSYVPDSKTLVLGLRAMARAIEDAAQATELT